VSSAWLALYVVEEERKRREREEEEDALAATRRRSESERDDLPRFVERDPYWDEPWVHERHPATTEQKLFTAFLIFVLVGFVAFCVLGTAWASGWITL
jgi:hypothetical protein